MREEPALAHSKLSRQTADREPFKSFRRGDLHSLVEDRLSRSVPASAPAVDALEALEAAAIGNLDGRRHVDSRRHG